MNMKLNLLESFPARGSDGRMYKVIGYERLVRDESLPTAVDRWTPTGVSEYRLDDGRLVDAEGDALRIHGTGVKLSREGGGNEKAPPRRAARGEGSQTPTQARR